MMEIPTYVWGAEDPNPPFQRRGYWSIYPYTLMDDLGEEKRPVSYRALVLENEYLRVIVLPELGGHLYSALDKPTGREIFYRNNVVKPGLIALRGAWISGGVEFNFPRGHTVTTISPVDSRLVRESDGSATAWVGNVERIHRMGWAVGIRLRPESSLIETEIRLTNRQDLPHPVYFWANAAVPARRDMRLVYPCTKVRVWGRTLDWPTHEGRDMATYLAHDYQGDTFALDSLEDFFGAYYEELDFGVVHVASVHDAFGKKFFTWGTSDHGRMWAEALSDGDGPYCEMQSGRFVDQGTWRMLPPHHTIQWCEHWYAVHGTGGFACAGREAAVRIRDQGAAVDCGVLATTPLPDAVVRISAGDRVLHEQRASLAPDRPLRALIPKQPGWPEGKLTLAVLDQGGRLIIQHAEGRRPRTIALAESAKAKSDSGEPSVGALLRDAIHAEERGDAEQAASLYERVLAADPACRTAAIALGRIRIESEPGEAAARLTDAAAAAPESAEAAYYLGVALARTGRLEEAEYALHRAAQEPEFAHAARFELGLIAMRRGSYEEAGTLGAASNDVRAWSFRAAAYRHGGHPKDAVLTASIAMKIAPFDRLAHAEAWLCAAAEGKPRVAARHWRALRELIAAGSDPWLELALDYAAGGLLDDALLLLEKAAHDIAAVRHDPLVHYAMACWLDKQGKREEEAAARRRAAAAKPDYVFPHHWEMEAILREAIAADGDDAQARYYLGNLLYAQGRRDEARREWEAAAQRIADSPVLFRNLGLAHREVTEDLEAAESWLRRAVALAPPHVRPYLELNQVLRARKASPQDRLAMLDSAPASVQRRGVIAAEKAVACMGAGLWDRALELLRTHTFHRWEMEFRMRRIWVDANLGRGCQRFLEGDFASARADFEAALDYPRNLRIGKPPRREDARPLWCAAAACERLADLQAAEANWEAAAAEAHHPAGSEPALYRALSLLKLARREEGEKLLAETLRLMEQCAEMAPEDANAQLLYGLALRAAGRAEEGAAAVCRALNLNPWLQRAQQMVATEAVL
jgi:tetratricopeptide (TPR) repeat protein